MIVKIFLHKKYLWYYAYVVLMVGLLYNGHATEMFRQGRRTSHQLFTESINLWALQYLAYHTDILASPYDEWRISRLSRSLEVAAAILLTRERNATEAVFDSSPSFTGEVLLLRKNPPFIRAHYRTWMEASGHNASSPETEALHVLCIYCTAKLLKRTIRNWQAFEFWLSNFLCEFLFNQHWAVSKWRSFLFVTVTRTLRPNALLKRTRIH